MSMIATQGSAARDLDGARQALPVHGLVSEVAGLVSPPGVFIQLQELMNSPTASAAHFGEIVARDPALTAKLLRLANGVLFGLRGRVETVTRAVTIIGMRDLYTLALSVSAVSTFSNIAAELVNMSTFWRHSVLTATLARGLAKQIDVLHPERLFVAGLLHDVGYLVLFHKLAPAMQDLLLAAQGDEEKLYAAERGAFGFTHADVAAELFSLWGLPTSISEVARHHHDPMQAGAEARDASVVALADQIAARCGMGALFEELGEDGSVDDQVLEVAKSLGIDANQIEGVLVSALDEFAETVRVFVE